MIGSSPNANLDSARMQPICNTMIYTVIPSQSEKCVFLTCRGDLTLSEMTTAWREVRLALAELGWKRVLVDVTALKRSPDIGELFDLAKLFWRFFPQPGRMALVVRWEQSTPAKLLENWLRSVGVNMTVFVSEQVAETWILEAPSKPQRSASDSLPKSAAPSELSKGSLLCPAL